MNILFFTRGLSGGGVAAVTVFLANKFVNEGHGVHIAAFEEPSRFFTLQPEIGVTVLVRPALRFKNARILRDIFLNKRIDFVINQIGHIASYCRLLLAARGKPPPVIISVFHNQPGSNPHTAAVSLKLRESLPLYKRLFLMMKSRLINMVYRINMKYVYSHSDKYILLSEKFIPVFRRFIRCNDLSGIGVIANPVTTAAPHKDSEKENIVLFVGRLDAAQKHVERILTVWELLFQRFSDWNLVIAGDGPDRENLERYCREHDVKRVSFTGYRDPEPLYECARVLVLTSEYEGFPLVLTEAMSYGVIPVVYHSFVSLEDIVNHERNGIIIEPEQQTGKFDKTIMATRLSELMGNKHRLEIMSKNAKVDSRRYSADAVYNRWMELFDSFSKEGLT
jgi:glycosyltransferase involved in cell wall biosynthesis